MKHRVVGMIAVAAVTVALAACGGDDEASGGGDLEAFCRLSSETDSITSLPSAEELEQFADAAPGEIRGDVRVIVDALGGVENREDLAEVIAALDGEDAVESMGRIRVFAAANCD